MGVKLRLSMQRARFPELRRLTKTKNWKKSLEAGDIDIAFRTTPPRRVFPLSVLTSRC